MTSAASGRREVHVEARRTGPGRAPARCAAARRPCQRFDHVARGVARGDAGVVGGAGRRRARSCGADRARTAAARWRAARRCRRRRGTCGRRRRRREGARAVVHHAPDVDDPRVAGGGERGNRGQDGDGRGGHAASPKQSAAVEACDPPCRKRRAGSPIKRRVRRPPRPSPAWARRTACLCRTARRSPGCAPAASRPRCGRRSGVRPKSARWRQMSEAGTRPPGAGRPSRNTGASSLTNSKPIALSPPKSMSRSVTSSSAKRKPAAARLPSASACPAVKVRTSLCANDSTRLMRPSCPGSAAAASRKLCVGERLAGHRRQHRALPAALRRAAARRARRGSSSRRRCAASGRSRARRAR